MAISIREFTVLFLVKMADVSRGINFNNPNIEQPSQKKKKRGMIPSIIGAGITLTIASFLLTRGGGTKFATQMNKIMAKMDDKIYELSKNGSKTASFM